MIEFITEPFTAKTMNGSETVPAIHCCNGIFVHRPIIKGYNNPSPIWTVSAKCGMRIKDCFIPHISFNEFLHIIEKQLCLLDWTGSFDEIIADQAHKEAASLFLSIIMPLNGIDYQMDKGEEE